MPLDDTMRTLNRIISDKIKAVPGDDGEWILDVLGVPYGGPINGKDAHGETFTPETELWLDDIPKRPVVYYHGLDEQDSEPEIIGEELSWKVKSDGVWFRVLLDKGSALAAKVWKAALAGTAVASSAAIGHLVRPLQTSKDGKITFWPIGELSLFDGREHDPANTYAVAIPAKSLHYYKSHGFDLPVDEQTESLLPKDATEHKERNHEGAYPKRNKLKGMKAMTPEELAAALAELCEELTSRISALVLDEVVDDETMKADDDIVEDTDEEIKASLMKSGLKDTGINMAEDLTELKERFKAFEKVQLEETMQDYYRAYVKKEKRMKTMAANVVKAARLQAAQDAPAENRVPGFHQPDGDGVKASIPTSITVAEERRFQPYTPQDMALAVKIKAKATPEAIRSQMTLGTLGFDEAFIRTMANKMAQSDLLVQPTRDVLISADRLRVKAARTFKANELDATNLVGQGFEWVTVWYDADLWERARDETELFNLMVARGMRLKTIPQGSKSMNIKLNVSSPTVYTVPEANSVGADGKPETVIPITPFGTEEVQRDAKRHALATAYTDDLDQDSLIGAAEEINSDAMQTLAESLESTIINGDTTTDTTNINSVGVPPKGGIEAPDYIAWDGVKHQYLKDFAGTQQKNALGAVLTLENYLDTAELYPNAIYNRSKNQVFIIDKKVNRATRSLGAISPRAVADGDATIFSGSIPPLFEVPVYTSGFLAQSDSSGEIDAVTPASNDKGQIINVYAPYWQYGRKMDVLIELDRVPSAVSTAVYVSVRHAFASRGANAAVGTFNIGV